MMGDADHFSRSTDRDIFSEEEGVKCRESEIDPEVITASTQSLTSQPISLRSKKTPRGKSSRKNNRRQALLSLVSAGSAENRFGYVNAAEHEEQFCSCVNLYVDYLLARAVEELVVDAPEIDKVQNGGGLSKDGEETGRPYDGVESEPVFTATDDSYMDLICEEIHSTLPCLPCDERQTGFDQEKCRVNMVKRVDLKDAMWQRDEEVSKNDRPTEIDIDLSPPLLSETEGKKDFEIAAEDYMNTSFPENEVEQDHDEYDSADDASENVSSSMQHDVDEDVSGTAEQRFKQQNPRRCRYEFEVDCETGMVFSFEVVEPVEIGDGSAEEYEYEDCDDCDDFDGRDSAELDDVDDESNVCLVEFEPDDESGVFRIIDENNDVEETVYMVVDEDGRDNKLAKKTSDFRSRSPKKLPRAMRAGTDSHRRRCYSTGDTERIESLESSSSEFYSHADTLDRFLTLPSPPKSSPGSYEVDDSEEELSSSQEELEGILDPPTLKNQNNAKHISIKDVIEKTANAFDGDLTVPAENESKSLVKNNQELQFSDGDITEPQDEDARLWQDLAGRHQKKLNELDLENIQHCEVSYNTNHRTSEVQPASNSPETRPIMPKHGCQDSDEMYSLATQETSHLNSGDKEMTVADQDERISTRHGLTLRGGLPLDVGCPEYVKELVGQLSDADGNHFEKIRNCRGRLTRRELNELLTDLVREQEAMDRMLRDAHRAQEEFIQLKNGVKKLLKRLESCQPA